MTSRNGNTYRVTGPLWGKSTGHRWFPSQRPVTRSFAVSIDLRLNKRVVEQTIETPIFEKPWHSLWRHCNMLSHHKSPMCLEPLPWETCFLWIAVSEPCPPLNSDLANPQSKLCHGWVTTFHPFMRMWITQSIYKTDQMYSLDRPATKLFRH